MGTMQQPIQAVITTAKTEIAIGTSTQSDILERTGNTGSSSRKEYHQGSQHSNLKKSLSTDLTISNLFKRHVPRGKGQTRFGEGNQLQGFVPDIHTKRRHQVWKPSSPRSVASNYIERGPGTSNAFMPGIHCIKIRKSPIIVIPSMARHEIHGRAPHNAIMLPIRLRLSHSHVQYGDAADYTRC